MKTFKKFIMLVLSFVFGFFAINISPACFFRVESTADFMDERFPEQIDILAKQIQGYESEQSTNVPIDIKTGDFMVGKSIEPESNEYGEVNLSVYSVNNFDLLEEDSVFIWCYIPHNWFYGLTISFYGDGNEILWNFSEINSGGELSYITGNANNLRGWKLIELKASDGIKTGQLSGFNELKISYLAESDEVKVAPENNRFAFYHIFKSTSISTTTQSGILYNQPSVIVIYAENFNLFVKNAVFVGDKFKFQKEQIIKKIIVNQENVTNNSNYSWKIVIKNENGFTENLVIGDEYEFTRNGNYTISLILISGTKTIYSQVFSIESEFVSLGVASAVDFSMKKGEQRVIEFSVYNGLELEEDIDIVLTDKNVAELTYYKQEGKYIVKILAKKSGQTQIKFSAQAKRSGETHYSLYTYSTNLMVSENANFNDFYLKLLLYLIIGLILTLILYIAILFVKFRHFVVK